MLEDSSDPEQTDGFRGQIVNGWRKGYGMARLSDELYYVGLFQDNKITGLGIIVAAEENQFAGCDSAMYYVGKVKAGKPEGAGKFYDAYGRMIYKGLCTNGQPSERYPSENIDDNHRFVFVDLDNGSYLFTEAQDTILDGSAFICGHDREMWIGRFRNNEVAGLSLRIDADGEWETFFVRNGEAIPQTSSARYAEQAASIRRTREIMNDSMRVQSERAQTAYNERNPNGDRLQNFMQSFARACAIVGEVANTAGSIIQSYEAVNGPIMSGGNSSGGSDISQEQYNMWARRAESDYKSITRAGIQRKDNHGRDAGGTNGQALSPGNYVMQKKSFREAQKEMKTIRQKALRRGIHIVKSEYEDIVITY